jgi:anthranilate phosphoribosyltransferase
VSVEALQFAIRRLAEGEDLSADESAAAFDALMEGKGAPAQIAALLIALRVKGETPSEVAGAAAALRRAMVVLDYDGPDTLVDTCGTGGGKISTFNISTAAALLAAGAGVRVAKHGNRSFTSRSGSADVLDALGVAIETTPEVMSRALRDAGIVFMFAPVMHPAMRHVGPVRKELAVPTIMNLLGPLANPARVRRQVIGVADPARLPLIAGALAALGSDHSLVVHGEPGMDEISPVGRTRVVEVRGGSVQEWEMDPAQYGVEGANEYDLAGGSPAENAGKIVDVLSGRGTKAAEGAVLLNAAAALYVSGKGLSMEGAVAEVRKALQSGAGMAALERLRAAQPKGNP